MVIEFIRWDQANEKVYGVTFRGIPQLSCWNIYIVETETIYELKHMKKARTKPSKKQTKD